MDENEPPEVTVIGWREYVDLPDWGLRSIRAKADTGARSTAVDVSDLEELPHGRVRFCVVARRGAREERKVVETRIVRRARVRSSIGQSHERLFVETTVCVAGRCLRTQVGLVNRKNMLSRMLLGRRSLEDGFVIDPSRCYLHGRRRRRPRKKTQEPQP